MIYFVRVDFDREVHAPALGFTKTILDFVQADSEEEGTQKVKDYYHNKYDLGCEVSQMKKALQQDPDRYISLIQ
ncbi:MAG: hypothetical protein CMI35_01575 [Owenweeksia sp.]|nr:hypothetical protein [Owenweeksia sp.]|tara:strand:+ start:329 stop:550 length:222 start_codon:yes stop_codon:yes gene_type:complete